jgi:hypothetical protein
MPFFKELSPDTDMSSEQWEDITNSETSWSAGTAAAQGGGNTNTIKTAGTVTLSEGEVSGTKITGVTGLQPGTAKLTWKFYTAPGTFGANVHVYLNGTSVSDITAGTNGAPTWTTTVTYVDLGQLPNKQTVEIRQQYKAGGMNSLTANSGLQELSIINVSEDQLGIAGIQPISGTGR